MLGKFFALLIRITFGRLLGCSGGLEFHGFILGWLIYSSMLRCLSNMRIDGRIVSPKLMNVLLSRTQQPMGNSETMLYFRTGLRKEDGS